MLQNAAIVRLSTAQKFGEAIRRSLPHIPADARTLARSFLDPNSLAIIAGTLAVWAGSHAFGIGEIVDVILLGIGAASVGFAVFEGAAEFYDFVIETENARTDADFEAAGNHFARAIMLLGVSTLQAMVLHGQGKTVSTRSWPPKYALFPTSGFRHQREINSHCCAYHACPKTLLALPTPMAKSS